MKDLRDGLKAGTVSERWVQNSQEVIIYSNVLRRNILSIYGVYKYYGKGSEQYKIDSKNTTFGQFVKFRSTEKDTYFGYGIKENKPKKPVVAVAATAPSAKKTGK